MMTIPVAIFLSLMLIVVLFQIALIFGAPWGEYTMGGKFPGKLSLKLRGAALAQILVLCGFVFIVLLRAGLILGEFYVVGRIGIWFVVGFFVLGSFANLTTPSKGERLLWGPANVILLIVSVLIALS
jgi:hypothetical protein